MKVLYVATKPPWPPVDGGRLLVLRTLEGLAAAGHRVTLVTPAWGPGLGEVRGALAELCEPCLVDARPRPFPAALLASELRRNALSIARHDLAAVRREVERRLDAERFDVVHVEQLQALAQAEPAFARGLPVVLRAQNVESDLWAKTARHRRLAFLARREARRLARFEGAAVARATATVALTREDALRLGELASGRGRIEVVRVPFAPSLEAASAPLAGTPAVVLFGSAGWLPNRDAAEGFLAGVWPAVRAALPGARLHLFGAPPGAAGEGVEPRSSPAESRDAFAPGSVLVVPLKIASGVRMKVLESWARGVPVVATPQAAAGLDAEDGRELLLAEDAADFVRALERLHREPGLAAALVEAGRAKLRQAHDPATVVGELAAVYASVRRPARSSGRSSSPPGS